MYNTQTKRYQPNTRFSDILKLYRFDTELSQLLFGIATAIEVSLRAHLSESLLIHGDPLALSDPQYSNDKKLFWENFGSLAREITRSNDVFIKHNYNNHNGLIPVWASVEVMSFGTLSKIIKNLKTGQESSAAVLLSHYKYTSQRQIDITPSLQMFSSWTHAVSILRNMCAHNSRIYNRTISTHLQIPDIDRCPTQRNGLYQIVLAMKYLRPTNELWRQFVADLTELLQRYSDVVDLNRINFPPDWESHMAV